MIHRFVDLLEEERLPDIPVLGVDFSPVSTNTVWQIGNLATPYRMTQTAVSTASSIHLGDPQREPTTGDTVVYSRFNLTGTINRSVRLVDWADTTDTQLYADTSGGTARSLQPTWAPDGSKIMFRAKGAGSVLNLIKTMNPDGTGVTTIYTGSNEVYNPLYNYDGTKIAWCEGTAPNLIRTANADGTGAATVYTSPGALGLSVAWKHGSNVIGFRDQASLAFTSNERWQIVNSDGTGNTTWLTISRASGYGPSDGDPSAIMYSWLESDTQIATTVRELAHADPDARLTLVTSGGNNYISPARYGPVNTGASDQRPAALTGLLEGVERIFYVDGGTPSGVCSVLPDGSDFRVDWDGTGTAGGSSFQGFRGDTATT